MPQGHLLAAIVLAVATCTASVTVGQLREQLPEQQSALEETPSSQPGAKPPAPTDRSQQRAKEKLSRVWANEPPLVRLARDKFGAELTETDAKFFAAVAESKWADFCPSSDTTYIPADPKSWDTSPKLKADRIIWLCTDPAAVKLVPNRGIGLRGAHIVGLVDLYRCNVPFLLAFCDCLFLDGLNISNAKLQELDIRRCCSAAIKASNVQVAENVYLIGTAVCGGLDFNNAQIGGNFNFGGGLAYHGFTPEDAKKLGIAISFHDAKIGGDLGLSEQFQAHGQVLLIGAHIGRTFFCQNSKFLSGGNQFAIDAQNAHVTSDIQFTGSFRAEGGVNISHVRVDGDLFCSGGQFIAQPNIAQPLGIQSLCAASVNIGGQVCLNAGFQAEGEVILVDAVVGGDINCNNGHFSNPKGSSLYLDGATIGHSLRMGTEIQATTDSSKAPPPAFHSHGTVSLAGAQISQDFIAGGAQFEAPTSVALRADNMRVGGRVDLSNVKAQGSVYLLTADIEHELDLRCSQFDAKGAFNDIALYCNGIRVGGHVMCNQVEKPEGVLRLRVKGNASFQFARLAMHWDLSGAQFINSSSRALDANDCRVGGYVSLVGIHVDGYANFARAKIDGMWMLHKLVEPEKMTLDLRFAHIWVIKDERLEDWPPAGQLWMEGLVYDHFDDDSPLDVNDRLAWLRRQYAPNRGWRALAVRRGSSDPVASADRKSPSLTETFGRTPARSKETQAQNGEIIPAKFEVPVTMPEQQMSPPNPISPPVAVDKNIKNTLSAAKSATTETKSDANKEKVAATYAKPDNIAPRLDPSGLRYITQPYTQLASVYRAIGQDEQANAVLVARAERIGELASPFSAQGLWYRYFGRLIGYGYEPFRAIKIGLVIIAAGALVFALGARRNLMAETKLAERVISGNDDSSTVSLTYPRFNAIVYSLDVFLPFVDLNQLGYWIPGEKTSMTHTSRNCFMRIGRYSLKWSSVLHGYLWFQTLAGWTLCTLLAAAVTGIVQS